MRYVGRRVAYLIPTWLGITLLAFIVDQLAPGNPAIAYFERVHLRPPGAAELRRTEHQLGLDQPIVERYIHWLGHALQGDLGISYVSGLPVRQQLTSHFPATLELATTATLLALILGIPLGLLAALYRNRWPDHLTRGFSLVAASAPSFWIAYLLIILFSVKLRLLPSFGSGGVDHLILPALTLGLGEAGVVARLARSSLLEVLREDYVTTARSKGLRESRVIINHALRNALVAVVTQAGLIFGFLMAYSAIVETIFVWPGIGQIAVQAITDRDYPMIQGFVVFAGTVFILVNLAVDLIYLRLDPRISLDASAGAAVV